MTTSTKKFTTVEAARAAYIGNASGAIAVAAQAKTEAAAMKAAAKAGKPEPKHPALDVITEASTLRQSGGKLRSKKASTTSRVAQSPEIVFTHDGVPMRDSLNRLLDVAWRFTANLDGNKPRIGVRELRSILAAGGVADPDGTEWSFKLANGITLGAVKRSSLKTTPDAKPAASAKAAAKTTKSAASKRDVTPIPKKSSRKRTSRKSAAA